MNNIDEIFKIDPNAKIKFAKKGELLQRSGESSSFAYFVKSGLVRSYSIDEKGKEHIFMFGSEDWILADIESQEFHTPTELFIDCLEDSEIVVFNRECLTIASLSEDQLRENSNLLARRIAMLQRRVLMLMSATARERYDRFLETYPELPNRVTQKMIASYLGITPEALSKIRGEIARTK